jgi:hypothetical protein
MIWNRRVALLDLRILTVFCFETIYDKNSKNKRGINNYINSHQRLIN